ncbi:MAG: 2-hydroxychromene-2-carboxylate isomerase [bacterium]|nr:2-hydroxychromene-2-carboxylate isomerase [bacterium]
MNDVRFHFDFVSPYSWLALAESREFAAKHGVRWIARPVVYAKLLEDHGLVGPAETRLKRRYTFHDVLRCAEALGLEFAGVPAHPFRSLEALRTVVLFLEDERAMDLAVAVADAGWGRGQDLTDVDVLASCVEGVGLDAGSLRDRIAAPEIKRALGEITADALELGVFGVPTLEWNGELFWGHDRLAHLAARIAGRLGSPDERAGELLQRPFGVHRRRH